MKVELLVLVTNGESRTMQCIDTVSSDTESNWEGVILLRKNNDPSQPITQLAVQIGHFALLMDYGGVDWMYQVLTSYIQATADEALNNVGDVM